MIGVPGRASNQVVCVKTSAFIERAEVSSYGCSTPSKTQWPRELPSEPLEQLNRSVSNQRNVSDAETSASGMSLDVKFLTP